MRCGANMFLVISQRLTTPSEIHERGTEREVSIRDAARWAELPHLSNEAILARGLENPCRWRIIKEMLKIDILIHIAWS